MLRPERMSRVSVAGSKRVLDDVIETVHDLHVVHLSDYEGSWDGFEPGAPLDGADEASERLVTARSLLSTLGVDDEDGDPARVVDPTEADRELEAVRERVNDLDDRRSDLEEELQRVDEHLATMDPLTSLGIDLDLLQGYDTLSVRVGEGNDQAVEDALTDAEGVDSYEVFSGDDGRAVAVFAYPDDESTEPLNDAFVGVDFAPIEVPDAEGSPEEYAADCENRRAEIESSLEAVESDIAEAREEVGPFLLATEEHLAIAVGKDEVPLSFATTENAFVAEGWIPTERFVDLAEALESAVGGHCDVDEIERASYIPNRRAGGREPAEGGGGPEGNPEAVADGGHETDYRMDDRAPPVVQDNPGAVKPFESLVDLIGLPNYRELDPTVVLFLTIPLFWGFMLADIGYGLVYVLAGYYLYARVESRLLRDLGVVTLFSGLVMIVFGFVYAEAFGFHLEGALWGGEAPLRKGLEVSQWAIAWLLVTVLAGLVHLVTGYVFEFVRLYQHEDLRTAVIERGSWVLLTIAMWVWIFSRQLASVKPKFLYTVFGTGETAIFPLGFTGFGTLVGWVSLAGMIIGLALVIVSEVTDVGWPGYIVGLLEGLTRPLVDVLSYSRIMAELLAEAGLALVINLLVFGAYEQGGMFHFLINEGPSSVHSGTVTFPGLIHLGIIGAIAGAILLVLGTVIVLVLGIASAGIQAVRLEYVEFFRQFYDGGGRRYEPFGNERTHTTDD